MVIQVNREKDELPSTSVSYLDPRRINILKRVNNEISRAVDLWTTRTLEEFVTEFAIDMSTSFSEAERQFFKGPRGKFFNSFGLRIKILLAKKGILLIELDC